MELNKKICRLYLDYGLIVYGFCFRLVGFKIFKDLEFVKGILCLNLICKKIKVEILGLKLGEEIEFCYFYFLILF